METRAARIAFLRQTALLGSLDDDRIGQVLDARRERRLAPDEALCHEGEPGHVMFVLLAGQLVVSKGGEQVSVGQCGDCFDEMAPIESRERAATLRARDEALVPEIPENVFRSHLAPAGTSARCASRGRSRRR